MTTIFPTNTCFDDVLDHQDYLARLGTDDEKKIIHRQHIVHGICLHPEGPHVDEPYAHAWIEDDTDGLVYQSGMLDGEKIWFSVERAEWYAALRVQKRTRYTFWEAMIQNYLSNHFGPWVKEYLALCGRSKA